MKLGPRHRRKLEETLYSEVNPLLIRFGITEEETTTAGPAYAIFGTFLCAPPAAGPPVPHLFAPPASAVC